jgi:hypothetical protein
MTTDSSNRRERIEKNLRIQIRVCMLSCIILIVIGIIIAIYAWLRYNPQDLQSMSLFGDYISGTVGALVSLASALLIYMAFIGQRLEAHQRQKEIDLSASQVTTQQFENVFISLLGFHHEAVKSLSCKIQGDNAIYRGRSFFNRIYQVLAAEYTNALSTRSSSEEAAVAAYESIYKQYRQDLGHYFRNLYNILKFIDESPITNHQKYANLLRAQLSSYELLMLFYNCLHPKGRSKFYTLASKYQIFESLPVEQLIANDHIKLYPWEAYGNRKPMPTSQK